jgi:hypothetical protein
VEAFCELRLNQNEKRLPFIFEIQLHCKHYQSNPCHRYSSPSASIHPVSVHPVRCSRATISLGYSSTKQSYSQYYSTEAIYTSSLLSSSHLPTIGLLKVSMNDSIKQSKQHKDVHVECSLLDRLPPPEEESRQMLCRRRARRPLRQLG